MFAWSTCDPGYPDPPMSILDEAEKTVIFQKAGGTCIFVGLTSKTGKSLLHEMRPISISLSSIVFPPTVPSSIVVNPEKQGVIGLLFKSCGRS